MQNFYQILTIQPTAKEAEIREALRNALRLWSNRTNAPQMERRQEAERMVKLIEEAETILLIPSKRAEYDQKLRSVPPDAESTNHGALDTAKDLIAEGRRLLGDGNIADALYAATKATERDGANPEAWALLGEARFRFGDVEDAIYEYKRAIKLKPNEPFYYYDLGDIYNGTDKFDDALTQYKRAAQMAPTIPMFRAAIGRVLLRQSKASEAIPLLEQCVKEEADNDYFQWELAIAYVDSSQNSWAFVPEGSQIPTGYYATSKAQVLEALSFIEKAEKLKFDDQELRNHIARTKEDVKRMLKRRYHGSTPAAIIGGMLWTCAYGLGLLFCPFYFYASRPPQYALNKHLLGGGTTGGDRALAAAGKVANVIGANENVKGGIGLAVIIGTGLFLPVMAIWNYVQNYTGENDLKTLQLPSTPTAPPPIPQNAK